MAYAGKNYSTDGGDKLHIGGTLEVAEDATVIGISGGDSYVLPAATADALGGVKLAANQAALEATELADVVTAFNALLAKLKTAGIMAAD